MITHEIVRGFARVTVSTISTAALHAAPALTCPAGVDIGVRTPKTTPGRLAGGEASGFRLTAVWSRRCSLFLLDFLVVAVCHLFCVLSRSGTTAKLWSRQAPRVNTSACSVATKNSSAVHRSSAKHIGLQAFAEICHQCAGCLLSATSAHTHTHAHPHPHTHSLSLYLSLSLFLQSCTGYRPKSSADQHHLQVGPRRKHARSWR